MSARLTRQDFIVTGVILGILVFGVPCLMWAVSSYRQEMRKEMIEAKLPAIIQRQASSSQDMARILTANTASATFENQHLYTMSFWDDLARRNAMTTSSVDQARAAIQSICLAFKKDLEKELPDIRMNTYGCSIFFQNQQGVIQAQPDTVYPYPEKERIARINHPLISATKPFLYQDKRDWLAYVLLQSEPRVVLELRLQDPDQQNN